MGNASGKFKKAVEPFFSWAPDAASETKSLHPKAYRLIPVPDNDHDATLFKLELMIVTHLEETNSLDGASVRATWGEDAGFIPQILTWRQAMDKLAPYAGDRIDALKAYMGPEPEQQKNVAAELPKRLKHAA